MTGSLSLARDVNRGKIPLSKVSIRETLTLQLDLLECL